MMSRYLRWEDINASTAKTVRGRVCRRGSRDRRGSSTINCGPGGFESALSLTEMERTRSVMSRLEAGVAHVIGWKGWQASLRLFDERSGMELITVCVRQPGLRVLVVREPSDPTGVSPRSTSGRIVSWKPSITGLRLRSRHRAEASRSANYERWNRRRMNSSTPVTASAITPGHPGRNPLASIAAYSPPETSSAACNARSWARDSS